MVMTDHGEDRQTIAWMSDSDQTHITAETIEMARLELTQDRLASESDWERPKTDVKGIKGTKAKGYNFKSSLDLALEYSFKWRNLGFPYKHHSAQK